jgi:hypothetical protein
MIRSTSSARCVMKSHGSTAVTRRGAALRGVRAARARRVRAPVDARGPVRPVLDEDMPIDAQVCVTVDQASRNLHPCAGVMGPWCDAAAVLGERARVRRRLVTHWQTENRDLVSPTEPTKIGDPHSEPGRVRRARRLAASGAMTKLERTYCPIELKAYSPTQASALHHRPPPFMSGRVMSGRARAVWFFQRLHVEQIFRCMRKQSR